MTPSLSRHAQAAAEDWPPSSSITSGLVYSTLAVGILAGPIAAGALYDASGSYVWGFRGAAAFCAAAAWAAATLVPPTQRCLGLCGCCGGGGGGSGRCCRRACGDGGRGVWVEVGGDGAELRHSQWTDNDEATRASLRQSVHAAETPRQPASSRSVERVRCNV